MLVQEKNKVIPLRVGMTSQRASDPNVLVIFGATGDLTHRKLMPALFDLYCDGKLPKGFSVVGFARREKSNEHFRAEMREAVLQDLGSRDRCTQRELLDLAKDERLTRMLGAGGVRCPLCHFPTRDGVRAWDGEWAPVAQAIQADYPDLTPAHGACVQCAELYRTRLYAVHG